MPPVMAEIGGTLSAPATARRRAETRVLTPTVEVVRWAGK